MPQNQNPIAETSNLPEIFLQHFSGNQIFCSIPDGEHGTPYHYYNDAGVSLTNLNGDKLQHDNKKGRGVFFTVNELDSSLDPDHKRTEKMLVRIRAVFADDDDLRDEPREDWPIPPNLIVNSSLGKFHYYWLIDQDENITVDQFNAIQNSICTTFKTDKQAKDVVRVLRLPGFYHKKKKPYLVQAISLEPHSYTHATLSKNFPPVAETYDDNGKERPSDHEHYKTIDECIKAYKLGHRHGPSQSLGWIFACDKVPFDAALGKMMELLPDVAAEHHIQSLGSAMRKIDFSATVAENNIVSSASTLYTAVQFDRLPDIVLAPDDLYGELVRALRKTMWKPNFMSAHIAADGVVAFLGGGKYSGNTTNDRLNFMSLLTGDSGDGKGIGVEGPVNVVSHLIATKHLPMSAGRGITSQMASPEAIEAMLAMCDTKPDVLLTWDEFGDALVESSNRRGASTTTRILSQLKELWPISGQIRSERTLVSNTKGEKSPKKFYAPCVSVVGAGTEDSIIDGMDVSNVMGGLIPRTTIYPCHPYVEPPVLKAENLVLSDALIASLVALRKEQPSAQMYTSETARVVNPVRIQWDEEIDAYFHSISMHVHEMDKGLPKILSNRKIMLVKKKAMLRAVLVDPKTPRVTMEHAEWANGIIGHSIDYAVKLLENRLYYSPFDAAVEEMTRCMQLRGHYGKWIKRRVLVGGRRCRELNGPTHVEGAITHLLKTYPDEIAVGTTNPARGRPGAIYRWTDVGEKS